MLEQLTLLLATPIAKVILNKFYKGIGNKLADKAINLLPEKVTELGQLIWEKCLKQEPKKEELLKKASEGSKEAQEELTKYLNKILENNPDLKQKTQKLAKEIHQNIEIKSTDTENIQNQNISDNATGTQIKEVKGGVVVTGSGKTNITISNP